MGIPNASHQAACTAMANLGGSSTAYIGLHTSTGGGTTGANEAAGGSYARQNAARTDGTTGVSNYAQVSIPAPAGTYTEGGIFSASSAGTFVGSGPFAGGNVVVSGGGANVAVTASLTA